MPLFAPQRRSKYDPLGVDDARRRIEPLGVGGASPFRLAHFVEPSSERGFDGRLILLTGQAVDEFPQCPAGDDPHGKRLS